MLILKENGFQEKLFKSIKMHKKISELKLVLMDILYHSIRKSNGLILIRSIFAVKKSRVEQIVSLTMLIPWTLYLKNIVSVSVLN